MWQFGCVDHRVQKVNPVVALLLGVRAEQPLAVRCDQRETEPVLL